jgi:hypothetical protein
MCVHQVDIADIEGKVAQVNSGSGAGAWNRPQQLTSRLSGGQARKADMETVRPAGVCRAEAKGSR